MGPLTSLESIAEVPDLQVTRTGNHPFSDFLSFFLSLSVSQASTIMVGAIKTIQMRKKWHKSLCIALTTYIVIVEFELFFSESQAF